MTKNVYVGAEIVGPARIVIILSWGQKIKKEKFAKIVSKN